MGWDGDDLRKPAMLNEGVMTMPITGVGVLRAGRGRDEEAMAGLLALLIAFLILYAIVLASLDSHPNASFKAKCILCQLNHDLSCTKEAKSFLLPPPVCMLTIFVQDDALSPCGVPFSRVGSRAPPLTFSGFPG
jgi:hypothetical protein